MKGEKSRAAQYNPRSKYHHSQHAVRDAGNATVKNKQTKNFSSLKAAESNHILETELML